LIVVSGAVVVTLEVHHVPGVDRVKLRFFGGKGIDDVTLAPDAGEFTRLIERKNGTDRPRGNGGDKLHQWCAGKHRNDDVTLVT